LVVFMTAEELDAVIANVRHVQNKIVRESMLDRQRPRFHVRRMEIRVYGNDWTTAARSTGRRRRIPDEDRGAAIVNRRCGIQRSISRSIPLYGSECSVRSAPADLTYIARPTRSQQRAGAICGRIRRKCSDS